MPLLRISVLFLDDFTVYNGHKLGADMLPSVPAPGVPAHETAGTCPMETVRVLHKHPSGLVVLLTGFGVHNSAIQKQEGEIHSNVCGLLCGFDQWLRVM